MVKEYINDLSSIINEQVKKGEEYNQESLERDTNLAKDIELGKDHANDLAEHVNETTAQLL